MTPIPSDRPAIWRKFNGHLGAILALALVAHGLMLLNDGVYWDGWLIYTNLIEKNWRNLYRMFAEAGSPITYYFHRLMGSFPDIVLAYRLVAFGSIALAAIWVYLIAQEGNWATPSERLWIALLSLVYPAMQVPFELINVPSVFYYGLFLGATLVALKAEKRQGASHYALRVGALVGFYLSFTVNSLLVFYFGFLTLLVLLIHQLKGLGPRPLSRYVILRRLDYLCLPVAFWMLKTWLSPRYGLYPPRGKRRPGARHRARSGPR